jgi:hypothetical protein
VFFEIPLSRLICGQDIFLGLLCVACQYVSQFSAAFHSLLSSTLSTFFRFHRSSFIIFCVIHIFLHLPSTSPTNPITLSNTKPYIFSTVLSLSQFHIRSQQVILRKIFLLLPYRIYILHNPFLFSLLVLHDFLQSNAHFYIQSVAITIDIQSVAVTVNIQSVTVTINTRSTHPMHFLYTLIMVHKNVVQIWSKPIS